jgi:hypothetical protein
MDKIQFLDASAKLRKLRYVCPTVRMEQIGSHWMDFFMKFGIWVLFENMLRKLKVCEYLARIAGLSHDELCTFMIISRSVLLRMRNVSDKSCTENQNTHFLCSVTLFFRKSCRLWDNVEKYGRDREANVLRRKRLECWLTKATDIHSEYVILAAFPRKQRLRERVWM